MTGRRLHRFGGVRLAQARGTWADIAVEHVIWAAGPGVVGEIDEPAHQLLVSLHGSAGRTNVRCADGSRYSGHDFPGAVTFVPAGCHRVATYGGGTLSFVGLTIPADRAPLPARSTSLRPFTQESDPLLHQIARTLRSVPADPTATLLVESASVLALTHLMQRDLTASRPGSDAPVPAPAALRDVVDFIEDNLDADLRLALLASMAGIEVHQLTRAFKRYVGRTPHRYVMHRRLERAAALLRAPDGPAIGHIAARTGMSSQSHLTTAFRREYGVTPAAYRADHRR